MVFEKTSHFRGDIFSFDEDISETLAESVQYVNSNKSLEKTCHRFTNLNTVEVDNFPAMNNLLMSKNGNVTNISYTEHTFMTTVTVKNTFVSLNDLTCEPFFCESITAHFCREDVFISEDCTHMLLGGNMITIEGIKYLPTTQNLNSLMNAAKDLEKGADKLVVLLEHSSNASIVQPLKQEMGYLKQKVQVKTNSKYIDLKIKKVTCYLELDSSSSFALNYKKTGDNFLMFLKNFLNGRGNLSSMKLKQALALQAIEVLNFEISNYADACMLIEEVSGELPSAFRTFGITFNQQGLGIQNDNEEKAKFDKKIFELLSNHSQIEAVVRMGNNEPVTHIHYSPIMQTCYQATPSAC